MMLLYKRCSKPTLQNKSSLRFSDSINEESLILNLMKTFPKSKLIPQGKPDFSLLLGKRQATLLVDWLICSSKKPESKPEISMMSE